MRGSFHYLYLIEDVWSRKIVGWAVHDEEAMEHSSMLIDAVTTASRVNARNLVLHSDNGSPMKGATMLATLQRLGIVASFSRPSVSDDNLHSAIGFVSPEQRHAGTDVSILAHRTEVYETARQRHPERWSGDVRNWKRVEVVRLNPSDAAAATSAGQDIAA